MVIQDNNPLFQFHIVRLKEINYSHEHEGKQSFNSI